MQDILLCLLASTSPITPHHDDPYEGLSDEELKEIWEDIQADYWINIQKS